MAEKFPVVFYIHGGEFEHGASNTFPGHMLAAVGDVVVVTVNYRLGALGNFLHLFAAIFHTLTSQTPLDEYVNRLDD